MAFFRRSRGPDYDRAVKDLSELVWSIYGGSQRVILEACRQPSLPNGTRIAPKPLMRFEPWRLFNASLGFAVHVTSVAAFNNAKYERGKLVSALVAGCVRQAGDRGIVTGIFDLKDFQREVSESFRSAQAWDRTIAEIVMERGKLTWIDFVIMWLESTSDWNSTTHGLVEIAEPIVCFFQGSLVEGIGAVEQILRR